MSHIIPDHPVCGVNHGHSYKLIVYLDGDTDIWIDFHFIKELIEQEIKDKYDHKIDPLTKQVYAITAEQLAGRIGAYLENKGYAGTVELWETEKFAVKSIFGKKFASVLHESLRTACNNASD